MDEDLEFKMLPHADGEQNRRVLWVVRGAAGATSFTIMRMPDYEGMRPMDDWVQLDDGWYMGIDLGYHHRFYDPAREYASLMVDCLALEGMPCYYEGSSLAAMTLAGAWRDANLNERVIKATLTAAYVGEFT